MFPLSDSQKSHSFPFISLAIIVANIFVFAKMLFDPNLSVFLEQYALIPSIVNFINPTTLYPFVTSMFLHAGFIHVFSNMWFLWIFGNNVEDRLGFLWFPALFILSGVIGGLLQYALQPMSNIPMLGASGAVSGVMGAYYVLFPSNRIKSVVIFLLTVSVINVPASIYIFYWFVIQFFSGIASIPGLGDSAGGIAFFAHIGGFLTGLFIAKRFIKREKKEEFIEGEIID